MGDETSQVLFILVISLTYIFKCLHQVISGKLCISDYRFYTFVILFFGSPKGRWNITNAQCPIPHFNLYWATNDYLLRQASYRSALVFLVQKFHKQGTNNYQLISFVLSINTCRLYA